MLDARIIQSFSIKPNVMNKRRGRTVSGGLNDKRLSTRQVQRRSIE
jgi:hypothetical protein